MLNPLAHLSLLLSLLSISIPFSLALNEDDGSTKPTSTQDYRTPVGFVYPPSFPKPRSLDGNAHFPLSRPGSFKARAAPQKRAPESVLRERTLTNGERLKRGLGPAAPQWVREKKRHPLAKRQGASPLPPATLKASIYCTYQNTTVLGWLKPTFADSNIALFGVFSLVKDSSIMEVEVIYDASLPPGQLREQLNMRTTQVSSAAGYQYIGGVQGLMSSDASMKSNSKNYAMVTIMHQTSPGAVPAVGNNLWSDQQQFNLPIESAIWTYQPTTKDLEVKWVNPDGSSVAVDLVLFDGKHMMFTGNPAQLANYFGANRVDRLKCILDS